MPAQASSPNGRLIIAALAAAGLLLTATTVAQQAGEASPTPATPTAALGSKHGGDAYSAGQDDASAALEERPEEAREEVTKTRTELLKLTQQRQADARKHTAQLNAAERLLREHKERLLGCETHIHALEAEIQARDAQIAALTGRLATGREAESRLNAHLATLRARLTAPEGGTVTTTDARRQADTDAKRLDNLLRQGKGINNPQLWQQVREAENTLHHSQFVLAQADSKDSNMASRNLERHDSGFILIDSCY